jgi:hypothetical protein
MLRKVGYAAYMADIFIQNFHWKFRRAKPIWKIEKYIGEC